MLVLRGLSNQQTDKILLKLFRYKYYAKDEWNNSQ